MGQNETEAAIKLWTDVKSCHAHLASPPPVVSDGWGGHREALLAVYGQIPAYGGRVGQPTHKQPKDNWRYSQMVKQHDEQGHFTGVDIRVIYGDANILDVAGQSTTYCERTNLTSRLMNSRLVRKTLGFSKQLVMLEASSIWEDTVYNLTRALKSLRLSLTQAERRWQPRSPAMAAHLPTICGH